MTYFNPKSIQGFNAASQGQFLYKSGDDIGFSNVTTKMKFVSFQSAWNMDDNVETFTYGAVNSDRNITVTSPDTLEERELRHILYLKNTGSENRTITLSANAGTTILGSTSFKLYGNSFLQLTGVAFKTNDDTQVPSGITYIAIEPAYGYVPYNAVENSMGFITVNDIPQSNWLETNASSRAYIQNKPSVISGIVFNNAPVTVTDGIATMSYTQAQANWTQNNPSEIDYIKNKPTSLSEFTNDLAYPTIAVTTSPNNDNVTITVTNGNGTTNQYNIPLSGGEGTLTQRQANWNETDSSSVQYILNKPTLANVATSGSYNDLTNTPSIPAAQVNSDWTATSGVAEILHKPVFSTVATTGQYDDLLGKPTLPAAPGTLNTTNTSSQSQSISSNEALSGTVQLHKISKTGAYSDLIGAPSIPVNTSDLTNDSGFITSQVNANWNETNASSPAYIQNKPSLHTVATSGDYNDLTNKPTIPTVPSNVSAFNNDADYITLNDIPPQTQANWNENNTTSPAYIQNKPSIPEPSDDVDYLRFEFTSNRQNRNFNLRRNGNPSVIQLEYKVVSLTTGNIITDWTEWAAWADGNRRITTSGPVVIYLRGDNYADSISTFTTSNYYHFYFDANEECYCYGNLMTIYKKDGRITSIPSTKTYRFYKLFLHSTSYPCNIKSAPYVKLQSAPPNCFTDIFNGHPSGWGVKDLRFDVIKGSENYVYERHQLNTAINPANGEIYVEKPSTPSIDSYVVTLLYGSQTIDFSTLISKYSAGAHIRCKDTTTVQGVEIYADMCAYDTYTNPVAGTVNRFTFKYVKAESDTRECWIYTCYKGTNTTNASWDRVETTLDEVPAVSSATWGKFLTNDSVNGLAWGDVLPEQSGHPGEYLMTNGAGVLSWSPASGGGGSTGTLNTTWNTSQAASISTSESLGGVVNLHKISKTGSYNDLLDTPTIPAAQVNADWNATSGIAQILNKPTLAAVALTGNYNDLTNKPSLADVAISGSYNDLSNKPTIPAAQVNSDWNASSGVAQILNKPTLATVATSGSYNDLSNKPTIPDAPVNADWNAVSGLAMILNKPTIPTTTSQLTNDSGFITASNVPQEIFLCTFTGGVQNISCDKTVQEIYDAKAANKLVIAKQNNVSYIGTSISSSVGVIEFTAFVNVFNSSNIGVNYIRYCNNNWTLSDQKLQVQLISGTNIKTINGNSLLGSGDLIINSGDTNVQSDWNQTNRSADDYIKNKPEIINLVPWHDYIKTSQLTSGNSYTYEWTINNKAPHTLWWEYDNPSALASEYYLNINFTSGDNIISGNTYTIVLDNNIAQSSLDSRTNIRIYINGVQQNPTWLENVSHFMYPHGESGRIINLKIYYSQNYFKALLTKESSLANGQ